MAQEVLAEWGMAGVQHLRHRVAVLVIVDVLSFSTVLDVAVSRGAVVHPFRFGADAAAQAEAERLGAVMARRRDEAGGFTLSPVSMLGITAGTRLLLPSPNGATLSLGAREKPVLAGCLRNAAAVADAARQIAGDGNIGVVPAGERWPDDSLRPAIEDLLGAGAIIDRLGLPCSAEALVARNAFRSAGADLPALIRSSLSGQELIGRGFPGDVDLAVEQEVSRTVPRLRDGAFRA